MRVFILFLNEPARPRRYLGCYRAEEDALAEADSYADELCSDAADLDFEILEDEIEWAIPVPHGAVK